MSGGGMSDKWGEYFVGKNATKKASEDKDQTEHKRDGSIVITNDNRNVYPRQSDAEREKPNWVEKGTLIVLALTFGAAVYAGIEAHRLANLTGTALDDARKVADGQSKDTAESLKIARDSAGASQKAANAAAQSADIAERTLRISQSASFQILDWETKNIEVGKIPFFKARLINTGHTHGTIISAVQTMTFDTTVPAVPDYSAAIPINLIIPPNGGHFIEDDFSAVVKAAAISQRDFDDLVNNRKHLYLWGRITYVNVFDETWDYGYIVQFIPIKDETGKVTGWKDVYPTFPSYTFLTKRPVEQKKPDQ